MRRCGVIVGVSLKGVVAVVTATTLLLSGCRPQADAALSAPKAQSTAGSLEPGSIRLETRWLIAPDPLLEPPLAAPLTFDVDPQRKRLYVLESQPPELRVHRLDDGRFVRTLGREGDGPGEYRFPISLAISSGGLVAVLSTSGRVCYWAADGAFLGSVRVGAGMATDIVTTRADSFYVKVDVFPPQDVSQVLVATPDTVLEVPRFTDAGLPGTEESGSPTRNHNHALTASASGELLLAPPGPDYAILRINVSGGVEGTIRRSELGPLRMSEREVEAVRRRVRRGFAAAGRPPPAQLHVPSLKPHISRLSIAPDGTIWALTRRGEGGIAVIDHFSANGEYAGSLEVALRVTEFAVTQDHIYLLARAELDLPGIAVASRPGGKSRNY